MTAPRHVLIPRFADTINTNAQNLNAKSLLTRFCDPSATWSMVHYYDPLTAISESSRVSLSHLLPRHLWKPHLAAWYQKRADAIFYPGPTWADEWGLRLRAATGRRVPLISTLEGLVGTPERERQLTEWAGHPVFCQRVKESVLRRLDYIYKVSDHIISISPFLARMGQKLYGDKFSVHMLGVEQKLLGHDDITKTRPKKVINIASLQPHKRPEVFLALAAHFHEVEFIWFGEGEPRARLTAEAKQKGLTNLRFAGPRTRDELVVELRNAYLFAMPSNSEGVPKVTQEAAACGLPLVIYGYYESPTVINGHNGFVVWSDDEFFERIGQLLSDSALATEMGARSEQMARTCTWDTLAREWENEILSHIP